MRRAKAMMPSDSSLENITDGLGWRGRQRVRSRVIAWIVRIVAEMNVDSPFAVCECA